MNPYSEDQLKMLAQRTPIPPYQRTTPAILRTKIEQAYKADNHDQALAALRDFAHTYGGFTDFDPAIYAWVHEPR